MKIEIYKNDYISHLYFHIKISIVNPMTSRWVSLDLSGLVLGLCFMIPFCVNMTLTLLVIPPFRVVNTKGKKREKDTYYLSLRSSFKDWSIRDQLISLGNSIELPALFKSFGWRLLFASMPFAKKTAGRLRQLSNFSKFVLTMKRNHGDVFTVKYLKASQLAVQKAIAGTPFSTYREIEPDLPLRRLTRSGLPGIIPLSDRRAIINSRPSVIRWWLCVFSVYRVIGIVGSLKISTITDNLTVPASNLELVGSQLLTKVCNLKAKWPKMDRPTDRLLLLETASPSFKSSWTGFVHDAHLLLEAGFYNDILLFFREFSMSNTERLFNLVTHPTFPKSKAPYKSEFVSVSDLGQLSLKKEAAGKIRVFAIVDVWTQSALKPLHEYLFKILRGLPNDGTFDQHASVLRCVEKVAVTRESYGYDLSAATDRLPIYLQMQVLSALFGPDLARSWARLLTGRSYRLDLTSDHFKEGIIPENMIGVHRIYYAVGQPMGALSSWAMLALTHHLLVQLACQRTRGITWGSRWYDNYELLGDDIIIFDEDVALAYLSLMEEIGVPINTSKSVVSVNKTTEFAKVTTHNGENVSAISWRMFLSQATMPGRVATAFHLMSIGVVKKHTIAYLKGILRHTKSEQGNLSFSYVSLLCKAWARGRIRFEDILKILYDLHQPTRSAYKVLLRGFNPRTFESSIAKFFSGQDFVLPKDPTGRRDTIFNYDSQRAERAIAQRILNKLDRLEMPTPAIAERIAYDMLTYVLHKEITLKTDLPQVRLAMKLLSAMIEPKLWGKSPILNPYYKEGVPGWHEDDKYPSIDVLHICRKEIIKAQNAPYPIHPMQVWLDFEKLVDSSFALMELVKRAKMKQTEVTKPALEKSALSPLSFLKDIKAFRPWFLQ